MDKTLIYGIVNKGKFYSDNMEVPVKIEDGIYSIDVSSDDYLDSISVADIFEFEKYIKNKPKMEFVTGYTFGANQVVPMDYIKWEKNGFPTITNDNLRLEEWSLGKFLHIPTKKIFFFLEYVFNSLYERLQEVRNHYDKNKPLLDLKEITPEMKLVYAFNLLEKLRIEEELKKLKEAEFRKTVLGRVETIISNSGGTFMSLKTYKNGYEIVWRMGRYNLNTYMNKNFGIIEAGFCLSGGDRKHTLNSIVKLLGDYIREDQHFAITRT
ncbi:MAG: hypothetical protein JETCAE03_35960 [Ignavibacteriaceae bacterium]|jgi:hypothetical protein|nr:MAG: hypothetical protein JETCAE03_35960 [Ignavibacteriaceae bacterium]